jgi:hypothetical protein
MNIIISKGFEPPGVSKGLEPPHFPNYSASPAPRTVAYNHSVLYTLHDA